MISKVICFASAKGGSGKTIISATLAKLLTGLGKKVLIVDMDAATNGLSLFYLEELVNARLDEKDVYLFSWNDVLRNDSKRLLSSLRDDLDIGWVENAEIRKSYGGKTILISNDNNSAKIMIDANKEKATLKISDGRIHDLKVKNENGKLNLYGKTPPRGIFEAKEGKLATPFKIDESTDMIPATYIMKQTEGASQENFRRSISETVSAFRDKYDYIILDAQAGSDIYAKIAIENADKIVIVSEYDPISAEGVDRLRHLFPEALSYDKTWILFNKVLPEFSKSLGDFLSVGRYLSPIPWDAEVVRAFARRKSAIDMERSNDYTLAIMRTAYALLGDEIGEEINRWKQDKEESIREPARSQLETIEEEMLHTDEARIETQYQLRDLQQRPKVFATYIAVGIISTVIMISLLFLMSDSYMGYFYIETFQRLSIAIIPLLIGIVLVYSFMIERHSREKRKKLEGQANALALRLEDLKDRRQKKRVLVESDIETLLEKRGY